ncbi:MAG: MerR family transcriptional regulator [Roseiarcus sp.]|uniref:MerR family transcriptional regulator n=1 Tax=Roseiarcus sp. TaxID=1969460 RepID=UPI003C615457
MEKSPEAFRTIREVAEAMALPQHVLRFWETRFPQIRPLKRAGGRRYYRPDDVERLRLIKRLLYDEGYTIKGVQRLFKEQGAQALMNGSFDARPTLDAAALNEFVLSSEPDSAPDAAASAERRQTATAPGRGGSSRPGLAPDDLAALRDSLEHIRQAERILTLARSPDA